MSPSDAHVDDDVLSLLALGEDAGGDAGRAHVDACARCTAELAQLRELVGVARAAQADGPLVAPAPHVWERIAGELGLDAAPVPTASTTGGAAPTGDDTTVTATPTLAPVPVGGGSTLAADPAPGPDLAPIVPLRTRRWGWVAGAAAAGVLVGGVGAWWATAAREPATTVVARATLDALPGWEAGGTAELETAADGSRVLVVDVADGTPDAGYREVWLLRPDVSGLVSLGPLTGTSGRFALPDDLDVGEFPVVDVSSEPLDGDPAHSGDSIVRGTLDV